MQAGKLERATRPAANRRAALTAPVRRGPTFAQLGHALGALPDLLPRAHHTALLRATDAAPAFPWSEAEAILAADLGAPPDRLFAHVEPAPAATGALAQVHWAILPDGTEVAVKIQRPGARESLEHALRRRRAVTRALEQAGLARPDASAALVHDLRLWMLAQLDLRRELSNMQRLHELTRDSPNMLIPRPHPKLSGELVLTADRVRGVPLPALIAERDRHVAWQRHAVEVEAVAENVIDAVITQALGCRFFVTDIHPSNLLAVGTEDVAFTAFGVCAELDAATREAQVEYLTALYDRDIPRMYRALSSAFVLRDESDVHGFRRDFMSEARRWLARMSERDSGARVGACLLAVVRAARRRHVGLDPAVLALHRTLVNAEAVAAQLGARADLASVGRDSVARLRADVGTFGITRSDVEATAVSALGLMRDGPDQLHGRLSELAQGRFALPFEALDPPAATRARRARARLVAVALLAVVVAALLTRAPAPALQWALAGLLCSLYVALAVGWRRLGDRPIGPPTVDRRAGRGSRGA